MTAMRPHDFARSPSRRAFVFGASLAAGGLALGLPCALSQPDTTRVPFPGASEVTVWIAIGSDDTVHIRVARSEMGQGISTALPMLVAEELDCEWARVRPDFFGAAENLARGRPWGDMVTSASVSVRASHDYLRRAGAQARQMLIAEAAASWNVEVHECLAQDSIVTHAATGRTVRYGAIAAAASRRPIPQDVPLKKPENWRLLGKRVRAIDTPAKVTGQAIYASDVRLPDMLYAAVKACPAHGGKLISFAVVPIPNPIQPSLAYDNIAVRTGNRVTQNMAAWHLKKGELVEEGFAQRDRQSLFCDNTSPGHVARVFGRNCREQVLTHGRPCAIGANE